MGSKPEILTKIASKIADHNPDMPGYGPMSTPPEPYRGEKCQVCDSPMVHKGGLCEECWNAEREDFDEANFERDW